ncbi:unnamed protein product [Ilex paraguariensis]|uniref:Uncharacterized protein n=1 Tax=Ilex paraguariensis TaxID=185542 RepID=A0ABC8UE54_9AQUA
MESVRLYEPFKNVSSDSEPIALPNLPHDITFIKTQVNPHERREIETDMGKLFSEVKESELISYGVIVNSFYELEPEYSNHYTKVFGRRAWHIGPLLLCNVDIEDKAERGKKASIDKHECIEWLKSKKPNSVVYLCFVSMTNFTVAQLYKIAMGLESSGQ